MNLKYTLNRIKKIEANSKQPDYEGFFRTPRGDFYVIGYLKPLNSNLTITTKKVVKSDLENNRFFLKKYSEWRATKK